METLYTGGRIIEVKQETANGVPVGIVEGHIAAFEPDQGGIFGMPDRFHRGAFIKSIEAHKRRDNRQIRLRDHHGRTVGGFPIETVHEDEIGLFARGEVNLEVQQGRELHSLARQKVLTDFSIGFIATSDKIGPEFRDIFEAEIIEASVVDDPLNKGAQITEVKSLINEIVERVKKHNDNVDKKSSLILTDTAEAICVEALDNMDVRQLEKAISNSGMFSKKAANILASRAKGNVNEPTMKDLLKEIQSI